jgi:hypothetical protein
MNAAVFGWTEVSSRQSSEKSVAAHWALGWTRWRRKLNSEERIYAISTEKI